MDDADPTLPAQDEQAAKLERKREYQRKYSQENRERLSAQNKLWREKNREKLKAYAKENRERGREKKRAAMSVWTKANEERLRAYRKAKYRAQKADPVAHEAALAGARERYRRRKERGCPKHKEWLARCNSRKRTNPKAILRTRMHSTIHRVLKRYGGAKAGRKTVDILGYSMECLERHLKKTMPAGATWNDYLSGDLHIDHIVPVSAFNFSSPDDHDFLRCFALENLRLIPAEENLRKSAKLAKPFQPSLI